MKKGIVFLLLSVLCLNAAAQNTSSKCYRAYIDAGYTVGAGVFDMGRFELSHSQGFQLNPYLFLGAGVGFQFMPKYEGGLVLATRESQTDLPVFANVRANFSKEKQTPFVDCRLGGCVSNKGGLYFNLSQGCRFSIDEKSAINVSVGYTKEKLEFDTYEISVSDVKRIARKFSTDGLTLKVGIEL